MFYKSLFVLLYSFFWPLCCLFIFDIQISIAPLVSSNSSYYHWVDVTAGGQFVPEDIMRPVAINCMNWQRSARILARTSPSIKRSEQDSTMETVSSGTACVSFSKDTTTTRLLESQIITLMTKFQIYVCALGLFNYMIFWIWMSLNNIVSFINVGPKTARAAIFWLQILISPAT
jgi:hypothetical protein